MKDFIQILFDVEACRRELSEFKTLLNSTQHLSERKDILPFFRERQHLSAFVASYHPTIVRRSRVLAYEYHLYGDFSADLIVGDSAHNAFCFVEFEDAAPDTIFRSSGRSTPVWSPRFLGGFAQIADWFWKLDEFQHTPAFTREFGNGAVDFIGLLVLGRSADLAQQEHDRLQWFRRNIVVNSKHVYCCTFDELCSDLEDRMDTFTHSDSLSSESE